MAVLDLVMNLNFSRSYDAPDPENVLLKFGENTGEEVDPVALQIMIEKAAPVLTVETVYESRASRPVSSELDTAWNQGVKTRKAAGGGWEDSARTRVGTELPWERCNQLHASTSDATNALEIKNLEHKIPWQKAIRRDSNDIGELFKVLTPDRGDVSIPWERAKQIFEEAADAYIQLFRENKLSVLPWKETKRVPVFRAFPSQPARPRFRATDIPWEEGRKAPPGRSPAVPEPPIIPPYVPFTNLNFECKFKPVDAWNVLLNFGLHPCPEQPVDVVARKVYFIVNSLHLTRVQDGVEIEILSASVGIDKSSWAWSFTGSIAYHEFEKIEPTSSGPVEVELNINGIKWRFLVEEYDRNETFGKTAINIKGRSVTAFLGAPYAPVRSMIQSSSITSRQFAEAELTRPGLITGFELDWMFPDELGWPMPAGTWSYNQLSPIDVINQLVQGAGGFVNSHPELKKLIVRPEYRAGFWDWPTETPDLYLPRALIRSQNLKWTEKPLYNGVYVSGENTGVQALVKKMGTLGDFQAPPYVSPMISHDIAARMKGLAILSSGGKQASVGLEMPMESSVGLIVPGMLIEVVSAGVGPSVPEWRGVITSTNINAAWGEALTVSQAVEVERHYGGF